MLTVPLPKLHTRHSADLHITHSAAHAAAFFSPGDGSLSQAFTCGRRYWSHTHHTHAATIHPQTHLQQQLSLSSSLLFYALPASFASASFAALFASLASAAAFAYSGSCAYICASTAAVRAS